MFYEKDILIEKINSLKKKKDCLILAHNYQRPEIYGVADAIGDSLELCKYARSVSSKMILFCGVLFMAESAKILNPSKTVLVPDKSAGCAMSDMVDKSSLLKFKRAYPGAAVVSYINSSAEVKSVSDVLCTSANAVQIVSSLPQDEIIFVPDRNLARYIASVVRTKKIIEWDGYCPIHDIIDEQYFSDIRGQYPDSKILAHPESIKKILDLADSVQSTSGMIEYCKNDSFRNYFVFTECGMIERLKKEVPSKNFFGVCNFCFDMKKNSLQSIYNSLCSDKYEIRLDDSVMKGARLAFENMFNLTNGG